MSPDFSEDPHKINAFLILLTMTWVWLRILRIVFYAVFDICTDEWEQPHIKVKLTESPRIIHIWLSNTPQKVHGFSLVKCTNKRLDHLFCETESIIQMQDVWVGGSSSSAKNTSVIMLCQWFKQSRLVQCKSHSKEERKSPLSWTEPLSLHHEYLWEVGSNRNKENNKLKHCEKATS